jgi:hypothetical protein
MMTSTTGPAGPVKTVDFFNASMSGSFLKILKFGAQKYALRTARTQVFAATLFKMPSCNGRVRV